MKTSNSFNNQKGIGLIEVMISIGISVIVLMGMLFSSQEMFKSQATAEVGQEISALIYEVNAVLYNESVCNAAIVGEPSNNGEELILSPVIQAGAVNRKLTIASVKLTGVTDLDGFGPGLLYSAVVDISGEKRGEVHGSKEFFQKFQIFYNVSGGGNITSCLGMATSLSADCLALGGTWDAMSSKCNMCSALGGVLVAGDCTFALPPGLCNVPAGTTWIVGANTCSSGAATTILNGGNCMLNDTSTPTTGSASFSCASGVMTQQPGAVCNTTSCTVAAGTTWMVGSDTCVTPTALSILNAASDTANDVTADPAVGSITYSCAAGVATPQPGATCGTTGCTVAAGVTWTVGANTCTVGAGISIADGSSGGASDVTGPTTGAITYNCSSGVATPVAGATCNAGSCSLGVAMANMPMDFGLWGTTPVANKCPPAGAWPACASSADAGNSCIQSTSAPFACANPPYPSMQCVFTDTYVCSCAVATSCTVPAGTTWVVGGRTCTAPAPLNIADGATATATDVTGTTGSATYRCTAGVFSQEPGATCLMAAGICPPAGTPCTADVGPGYRSGTLETIAVCTAKGSAWSNYIGTCGHCPTGVPRSCCVNSSSMMTIFPPPCF